ncbi:MAG: GtrA family protein [Solirubrobacteraceae bacterium]
MQDELTTSLELPAPAQAAGRAQGAYARLVAELRHPENHKQLVRFLCVGVTGYIVNIATFALCIHVIGVPNLDVLGFSDVLSLVAGFFAGGLNNFYWNRHWTFAAHHEPVLAQALRFFGVSAIVFLFATGIYRQELAFGLDHKTVADGISWIIATPLSFLVQKLWSFKA